MTKVKSDDKLITRSILKKELKPYATKKELNEWGETLNERINTLENNLTGRMDGLDGRMDGLDGRMDRLETRMDRLESHIEKLIIDFKDQIFTKIDKFMGRVSDLDDESAAGNLHLERIDKTLANHDKRIKKLEAAN